MNWRWSQLGGAGLGGETRQDHHRELQGRASPQSLVQGSQRSLGSFSPAGDHLGPA